jgi:hypothetical protein
MIRSEQGYRKSEEEISIDSEFINDPNLIVVDSVGEVTSETE